MSLPRFLQHIIVLCYLIIAGASLLFTVIRIPALLSVPLAPFSYGMMAPYQSFNRENVDVRAEGEDEKGIRHAINLDGYYTLELGEKIARRPLFIFRVRRPESQNEAYAEMARQLMKHEREQGRDWKHVRLYWDSWPVSAQGYEGMRTAPFVKSIPLAIVP